MAAQDLHTNGVERAKPRHAFDRFAHHGADTVAHFARRLVGEGHRKDLAWPGPFGGQNMRDAGGQHPGLARARSGQHKQRPLRVQHGFLLLRVQPVQIGTVGIGVGRTRERGPGSDAQTGRRLGGPHRLLPIRVRFVHGMDLGEVRSDCEGQGRPLPLPLACLAALRF